MLHIIFLSNVSAVDSQSRFNIHLLGCTSTRPACAYAVFVYAPNQIQPDNSLSLEPINKSIDK